MCAGFLAAELESGKPAWCAVLQNIHILSVESVDISEETANINVDKLRKIRKKLLGMQRRPDQNITRKDTYIASVQKLQERLHRSVSSITEQSSVTEMNDPGKLSAGRRTEQLTEECTPSGKNP